MELSPALCVACSYAECHLEMGKIDDAVKLYKKAMSMDPDGFVGQNAKTMLDKIAEFEKAEGGYGH